MYLVVLSRAQPGRACWSPARSYGSSGSWVSGSVHQTLHPTHHFWGSGFGVDDISGSRCSEVSGSLHQTLHPTHHLWGSEYGVRTSMARIWYPALLDLSTNPYISPTITSTGLPLRRSIYAAFHYSGSPCARCLHHVPEPSILGCLHLGSWLDP